MLSISIKFEQMNRTHKNDSTVAFYWYTAEGPSYIKS